MCIKILLNLKYSIADYNRLKDFKMTTQTLIRRLSLILAAVFCAANLILSLFLMVRTWQARQPLQTTLDQALNRSVSLLLTTDQALQSIETMRKDTLSNLDTLEATALTLSQTAHDTQPLLESLGELTGQTLPETISATQKSLTTAQSSAKLVESILSGISSIPFFPGEPYQPQTPLHLALGQISKDLEKMRPQLEELQTSLVQTQADSAQLESDLIKVAIQIGYLQADLEAIQPILIDYSNQTARLVEQVQALQTNLPGWVNNLAGLLLFVLFWMAVLQGYLCIRSVLWLRTT
jgi:septal ring factor EnvC (AmiA/AmiB activator)